MGSPEERLLRRIEQKRQEDQTLLSHIKRLKTDTEDEEAVTKRVLQVLLQIVSTDQLLTILRNISKKNIPATDTPATDHYFIAEFLNRTFNSDILETFHFQFIETTREVSRGTTSVYLTVNEAIFFGLLLRLKSNEVFSEILLTEWAVRNNVHIESIEATASRLRKKLKKLTSEDGSVISIIKIRTSGYILKLEKNRN